MAEIKIEKKKPVWPWILLGLIILAVILYFVFADEDTDDVYDDDNTEQVITTSESEENMDDMDTATWEDDNLSGDDSASMYVTHIGDTEKMGIDHEYSSEALVLLINALENRTEEANINTDIEIQELKNDVRDIKEDPQSLTHANAIKNVGMKIANLMEKVQKEKFPNISQDVQEVRTAVQNIQPSTPTLDQKDAVNSFYKEAGDVLQNMKMS
jgi:hypothetical protein